MKQSLLLILFISTSILTKNTDLIVFSYDRPLQLHAFLESSHKFIEGISQFYAICRASNIEYRNAYEKLAHHFPAVLFNFQSNNPKKDFKPLLINTFQKQKSSYVLFAVDDIIVKEKIVLSDCIEALEKLEAYAFFLRLGKNITGCYTHEIDQPILKNEYHSIYSWVLKNGLGIWQYPNNVDMTLYRKKDISALISNMPYNSPNTFESNWSGHAKNVIHKKALCFETSKIVNIPLNIVQSDYKNKHMNYKTPKELLLLYLDNKKIDISQFYKINNNAPHMNYKPEFKPI